jgi:hypothetical protein
MVAHPDNKANTETISTVVKIAFLIAPLLSPASVTGQKFVKKVLFGPLHPYIFSVIGGERKGRGRFY